MIIFVKIVDFVMNFYVVLEVWVEIVDEGDFWELDDDVFDQVKEFFSEVVKGWCYWVVIGCKYGDEEDMLYVFYCVDWIVVIVVFEIVMWEGNGMFEVVL